MTDDQPMDADPTIDESNLAALLSDPTLWDGPEPNVEDAVVSAIVAERDTHHRSIAARTRAQRWLTPIAVGVAAAVVVLAGAAVVARLGGSSESIELALTGTELAPEATAVVEITDTPRGTRLVLDVSGLPPAAQGTYYEAWLRQDADVGVSAGTFHLRGAGDDPIELWAGVTVDDYPLIAVTVQPEAESASSGRVVLRGLVEGAAG